MRSPFANKDNVLELDNTTTFTPDADYEPATKKYVDDTSSASVDLQDAYDNSVDPEILTDATREALTIKRGSVLDTDNVFEIKDGSDTITVSITGEGNISTSGTIEGRDVADDGIKLDGIETGAQVNTVDSVNGEIGTVVLDADDIDDLITINKFTNQSDIDRLANTSGTNTGDQVASDFNHDDLSNVHQDVTTTSSPTFVTANVDSLQIDTVNTPIYSAGQIRWGIAGSTAILDTDETDLHVPLVESSFKIKNLSGGIVTQLTCVYPTGATGDNPTVDLADATDFDKSRPVGLIRSVSIADTAVGYVTIQGKIAHCDTSAWLEGDKLYLSETPGELVTTKPSYPSYPIRIGVVSRSHATEGIVIVDSDPEHDINQDISVGASPEFDGTNIIGVDASNVDFIPSGMYASDNVQDALGEINTVFDRMDDPTGFDRSEPTTMGDISFGESTRTFTIEPKSGEPNFTFLHTGKLFTKTSAENIVIDDTDGMHFIYYDSTGTLSKMTTFDESLIIEDAIVSVVYWNSTAGTYVVWGDERHGDQMDGATHLYNHATWGALYSNGIDIEGLVDGGTTYTQTTSGEFHDEDIKVSPAAQSTSPFWYRNGSGSIWNTTTADNNLGYNGGAGNTYYNQDTGGGICQLTSLAINQYVIYHFVATNNVDYPIVKVIGQDVYSSKLSARAAIQDEIHNIALDGLPTPEFIFLYSVILNVTGELEELSDGSTYVDFRTVVGSGSGGTSASSDYHADLLDTDIDGHPASTIIPGTLSFDKILSSADDTVQKALDTIDDHTHTATDVTDFDTEVSNNTDVALNTTHRTSNGTDHTYINQDVTTIASPTFDDLSLTGDITLEKANDDTSILFIEDNSGVKNGFKVYNDASSDKFKITSYEAGAEILNHVVIDRISDEVTLKNDVIVDNDLTINGDIIGNDINIDGIVELNGGTSGMKQIALDFEKSSTTGWIRYLRIMTTDEIHVSAMLSGRRQGDTGTTNNGGFTINFGAGSSGDNAGLEISNLGNGVLVTNHKVNKYADGPDYYYDFYAYIRQYSRFSGIAQIVILDPVGTYAAQDTDTTPTGGTDVIGVHAD